MSAASVVCGLPAAVARSRNQQPCVRPQQRGAAAALAARRPATAAAACQRRAVVAAAASSSSSATAVDVEAQMGVLRQACRTKDVPAEEVMAAMEALEAAHKAGAGLVQGFPGALTGSWRLVFSAPSPIKAFQYIPVLEDAIIDAAQGTVDLASVVGPLDNVFKGRGSFRQDPSTATFAMDFGFTASEATWFGRWHTRSEFAKEKRKTYSFFLLTDELAAAQSSGGPKTLMYRVK